jgi:predicted RNA-binding protein Jag
VSAEAATPIAAPAPDKRVQVEQLLTDIFRLAEWPAKLELKDAADGGIAVAVHFDAEVPGVVAGKKSYLIESLQFLVNKVVNRPNTEKRWVTLGVGGFPEPKAAPPPAASQPKPPPAAAKPASQRAQAMKAVPAAPKASAPRVAEPQEAVAEVEVSAEWKALAKLLSGKAVKHGRVFALMSLDAGERAQVVKALSGEAGLRVKVEGDGHFKRLVVTPDKLTPMPRKMQFPDDEEDDDGED